MRKLFLITTCSILFASPAFAGETVNVRVNGMVCDFCARAVEKVFTKQDAVESLTVDLSAKQITVLMKDGQTLGDDVITKLVTDSGYALVGIERGEHDEPL